METYLQSAFGIDSTSEFNFIERHIIIAEVEEYKVFLFNIPFFLFYYCQTFHLHSLQFHAVVDVIMLDHYSEVLELLRVSLFNSD